MMSRGFDDEAIAVRCEKCQAGVGIAGRHVAIFEAQNARPQPREIDRADDRPVVAFGIDLNQIDVRPARRRAARFRPCDTQPVA